MNSDKRKRLEAAGWKFGSAAEFLKLTPEEEAYIDLKLSLSQALEARRKSRKLTQKALAVRLKSSQPRVAMMEKGDPSVSVDLLVRGLFALGVTRKELARAVSWRDVSGERDGVGAHFEVCSHGALSPCKRPDRAGRLHGAASGNSN